MHVSRLPALAVASLALVSSSALAQFPGAEPVPREWAVGFQAIQESQMREWLFKLAGPEFEGRGTGQRGYQLAAEWMAERFRELGLKPIGDDGSYFQNVPFDRTGVTEATFEVAGRTLRLGTDFVINANQDLNLNTEMVAVRLHSAEGRLTAETAQGFEGKIVVVDTTLSPRDPALVAARRLITQSRPALVLNVVDRLPSPEPSVVFAGRNARPARPMAPSGSLLRAFYETMSLVADREGGQPEPVDTPVRLSVTVKTERIGVPNVVGLFEGSDPNLRHEVVAVGSHLDHLGIRNGVIYPGADDDGSGSVGLLGIARALQANPVKPKRSILFLAFAAEEIGLIGSGYYAENPIIPLENTLALFQMDMIGRNQERPGERPEDNTDTVKLVGTRRISSQMHELMLYVNRYVNLVFQYDQEDVYTRSDHYQFARRGVPVAFMFTGFHPDYHQPTDTPDKINYEKMTNITRLIYLAAVTAANRDGHFPKDILEGGGG